MTTVVSAINTEINTPTSYVSRWIAQSHGTYQKKGDEYYPLPSSDYRSSIVHIPIQTPSNPPTTTWQAQAKTRSIISSTSHTANISSDQNNQELQNKLKHIR